MFCTAKATPRFQAVNNSFWNKTLRGGRLLQQRRGDRERERRVRTTIQTVHSVLEGGLGLKIAAASPAVHLLCVKQWLFMQRAAPAVNCWGLVWLDECQMPACLPGAPSWVNTPAKPPPPLLHLLSLSAHRWVTRFALPQSILCWTNLSRWSSTFTW